MISVIIPAYNAEDTIRTCIDSVLSQSYSSFEIIAIDNMSSDRTAEIIKSYEDGRIIYTLCEDRGVSFARNRGIEMSKGDFIFFLDSDDTLVPDALMKMYTAALSSEADIVIPNISIKNKKHTFPCDKKTKKLNISGKKIEKKDIPEFFCEKSYCYILYFVFKLYKKTFIINNNIKFSPKFSLGEDLLFNIDAYNAASAIYYLSEPLVIYDNTSTGLNKKYREDFIEIKLLLNKYIKEYLIKHNAFTDKYYISVLNEIIAMMNNEPTYENIERVLTLDIVSETVKSGVKKYLPLRKKIALFCLKYRIRFMLRIIIKYI